PLGVLAIVYGALMSPRVPASPTAGSTSLSVDEARALVERAQALTAAQKYEEALVPLTTLFKANPTNHIYAGRLADLSNHLGRYREEAQFWEQFVRFSPNPVEGCPQIADAYWKLGQQKEFVDASERCLGFDPENPDEVFYLARAYERTLRFEDAAKLYHRG